MEWTHKWAGKIESGYYSKLLEKGFISEGDQEPEIGPFGFYLDAFSELSSCRVSGMSLGSIPFTAIVEYSRIYEVGDFEEFRYLMRLMDRSFVEMSDKKSSGNRGKNGTGATSKTNQN